MKKLHIFKQPFVISTGLAALVHSTWSLATLFNGKEPVFHADALSWLFWVAPALLIALSVDVGQMATASEIQAGERGRAKYATFAVFAVATYFLQWYHLAHHIPLMDLAQGVREDWRSFAGWVSDSMVWLVPALLPLSTFLYTFSSRTLDYKTAVEVQPSVLVQNAISVQMGIEQVQPAKIEQMVAKNPEQKQILPAPKKALPKFQESSFLANCPDCGWSKSYETELGVKRAMVAHKPHCKGAIVDEQVGVMEGVLA